MKKKNQKSGLPFAPMGPTGVVLGLKEARNLVAVGDRDQALARLIALEREYPAREDVLRELLQSAQACGREDRFLYVLDQLWRLNPDDEDRANDLAKVQMDQGLVALGVERMQRLLVEVGDDPKVQEVAEASGAQTLLQHPEFPVMCETQRIDYLTRVERYDDAVAAAQAWRAAMPDRVEAAVCLADALFDAWRCEDAVAAAHAAVAAFPDHARTLACLGRIATLCDDTPGQERAAAALRDTSAQDDDDLVAVLGGLTFVGDADDVTRAFRRRYPLGMPALADGETLSPALAQAAYLTAAAHARRDEVSEARALWEGLQDSQEDERLLSDLKLALSSLELPAEERGNIDAFPHTHWFPARTAHAIDLQVDAGLGGFSVPADDVGMAFLYERIAFLLERGGPLLHRYLFVATLVLTDQRLLAPLVEFLKTPAGERLAQDMESALLRRDRQDSGEATSGS